MSSSDNEVNYLNLKAFKATIIVEKLIKIAPKAGESKIPLKAKIPIASGRKYIFIFIKLLFIIIYLSNMEYEIIKK